MSVPEQVLDLLDRHPEGLTINQLMEKIPGVCRQTIRSALFDLKRDEIVDSRPLPHEGRPGAAPHVFFNLDNWTPQPWRHPYRSAAA
jgi:hypothetical protein